MPTEITVRGTFTAFHAPERGTVHATIAFEGPAMEPVYDRVARDLEAVMASVTPLKTGDHGPVTWWSADQVRTWSSRPWNKDGKQLPLVHHASVGYRGEVPRLRRSVALGRPTRREHRRIPDFTRRVGAHLETADGAADGRSAPGPSKTPSSVRSSMPMHSNSARSIRSPSPTPECWLRARTRRAVSEPPTCAQPDRPQAARRSNCCRSTSRYRRRSTRGSLAGTPTAPGVAFASWRNSRTGFVQT